MKYWLPPLLLCMHSLASAAPPPAAAGLALLNEAERMFTQGDTLRALGLYQAVVEQDRNNPRAWLRIGELYRRDGQIDRALDAYAEIGRIYPNASAAPEAGEVLAQAHLERARLYAQLAQQELALARDLPANAELRATIAQADSTLAGTRLVTQARSPASATGKTIEIAPVRNRDGAAIQVIRGGGSP